MPKKGYKQSKSHIEARILKIRGRTQSDEERSFRVQCRRINNGGKWAGGRPANTEDVIWSKVKKGGPNECWPWIGYVSEKGYGRTWINNKGYYAHRVIYNIVNPRQITLEGPRRGGYGDVMHTCDNPVCCNPSHLVLGTHADNMADMRSKDRGPKFGSIGSPRAKLTMDDVLAIRRQKKEGATVRALALLYDVSMSTISGCLYGRHYQDIQE